MTDDGNVLAADKRRALTRLQELEDEARIDAVKHQADGERYAEQRARGKADGLAIARDVVNGKWF